MKKFLMCIAAAMTVVSCSSEQKEQKSVIESELPSYHTELFGEEDPVITASFYDKELDEWFVTVNAVYVYEISFSQNSTGCSEMSVDGVHDVSEALNF